MKNFRFIILLSLLCTFLSSCTNDQGSSVLELNDPVLNRMDAALTDSFVFQVDITVNSRPVQSFSIDPTEANKVVVIAGVRRNEQNSIEILWQAIVEDTLVELSKQTQVFFADGNTIIDAQHDFMQYDFDSDAASNLLELISGTCIWSANEDATCMPPEQTNNILLGGDFSAGIDLWWSRPANTAFESNGNICVNSSATAITPSQSLIGYGNDFRLDTNSSYKLSFKASAQIPTNINVSVTRPSFNFDEVFTKNFEVFETPRSYDYLFETRNLDYGITRFVYNLGNGMENTYCFDDMVLEKLVDE